MLKQVTLPGDETPKLNISKSMRNDLIKNQMGVEQNKRAVTRLTLEEMAEHNGRSHI